jgi:hypothetical protein
MSAATTPAKPLGEDIVRGKLEVPEMRPPIRAAGRGCEAM